MPSSPVGCLTREEGGDREAQWEETRLEDRTTQGEVEEGGAEAEAGEGGAEAEGGAVDVEQGANSRRDERRAMNQEVLQQRRQVIEQAIEIIDSHYGRSVNCLMFLNAIAALVFVAVSIWLAIVFVSHRNDECDVPLDIYVYLQLCVVVWEHIVADIVAGILQAVCGWAPWEEGRVPLGLKIYIVGLEFVKFLLLCAGLYWGTNPGDCPETAPELYSSVFTHIIVHMVCQILMYIHHGLFIFILYLIRNGALNTTNAAEPGSITRCEVVKYDKSRFNDEDLPVVCSVCFEEFDDGKEIRMTPCSHTFHTQCLEGWFKVANSCPNCRTSIVEVNPSRNHRNGNGNDDATSSAATNAPSSPSSPSPPGHGRHASINANASGAGRRRTFWPFTRAGANPLESLPPPSPSPRRESNGTTGLFVDTSLQ